MTNLRKAVLASTIFVLAAASLALGQGTYTQIDVPGATQTSVQGIDSAGDVVGSYSDSSNIGHGFLLSDGTYTTIDYPGARRGTSLNGINDGGQIVGTALGVDYMSFVYDIQTQTFTTLSRFACAQPYATSINNSGTVAGYCDGANGTIGFEMLASGYKQILPPGEFTSEANGISGSGKLVGYGESSQGIVTNFLFYDGRYKQLLIPNAPNGEVIGINNAGTAVVGTKPSSCPDCGFVYKSGSLQVLQFPGAIGTGAIGVNDEGEVVGSFDDTNKVTHGFTWTPPASGATK